MDDLSPPAWVRKRDGRLEPFDADKISRALFAASESIGRPDAFLARELTDGVAHFLGEEADGATSTTIQVAELVAKVVRELGQPALAAAFAEHGQRRERRPRTAAAASSGGRVVALDSVFARDLEAAHGDGLLMLTGLETPAELAACVLGPPGKEGVGAAVVTARRFAGGFLVLDGPEYLLSLQEQDGERQVRAFARDFSSALRLTGLRAVVNLNGAAPPPWAGGLADGPLFAGRASPPDPDRLAHLADQLLAELQPSEAADGRVRIHWHLSERDFQTDKADRLTGAALRALQESALCFVFDRPRRAVALAEGVDRRHPALLLTVGLSLPRLAEQPGVEGDPARFLKKLGSLARLALSAAVQKRDFLRRREAAPGAPPMTSGFLLDRARFVAAPVGLDSVVQRFTGGGLCSGGASLEFGKQIVRTLRDVLRQDGGRMRLATCLDGPDEFHLGDEWTPERIAGLTAWQLSASVKSQLRAAGALHAGTEGGAAALFLPDRPRPTAETIADTLRIAWKQGDVSRVRFVAGIKSDVGPAA